tara:strand:- start:1152 stop:1259 length:108 start_codon:yes stop_codon:yes gene_type:complete
MQADRLECNSHYIKAKIQRGQFLDRLFGDFFINLV